MNAPVSLQSLAAGWTEERVELLTKLHREGLSCAQIAKRLHGVTRNAVIGKVSRLGLNGAAAPRKASAPGARKPPSVPRPPRAPKPQPVEIASGHVRTPPSPKAPKPAGGVTLPPRAASLRLSLRRDAHRPPLAYPSPWRMPLAGRGA
jgi:GcrA cell cycle regulator